MTDNPGDVFVLFLILGLIIVAAPLIGAAADRASLPAMAGYIVVGMLLGQLDRGYGAFPRGLGEVVRLFAEIGVVVLLFRIGLESRLRMLLRQFPRASMIWLGDVAVSGALGYLACRYVLGYALIPSLFVAAALSATSVGIVTVVWHEQERLRSETGALLTDVAELDDISAIFFMALLFALAPILRSGNDGMLLPALAGEAGWLAVKFAGLTIACIVFSNYIERPLTHWFGRVDRKVGPVLLVTGCAFVIAATADRLGFSLAIGAAFAGLAFSRDPSEREIDRSFEIIYRLFSPFFFVGIGYSLDLSLLGESAIAGWVLLAAAVLGKLAGAGLPAFLTLGAADGLLVGVSMIPRAEIALIIMAHGLASGDWAVPLTLYGGMVLVVFGTCIFVPPVMRHLLHRFPQRRQSHAQ